MPKPHRHLPASAYQRRDDPIKLIAEKGRAPIRVAVAKALAGFRKSLPTAAVETAIKCHDYTGAINAIDLERLKRGLGAAFHSIAEVHHNGAAHGAAQINKALTAAHGRLRKDASNFGGADDPWAFDLYAANVLDQLAAYQADFINDLTDDVRQQIFDAIMTGVRMGVSPEDVAASIRDGMALTPRQAQAVANYRTALENGSSTALDRALRDADADEEVRAAIDAGNALSQDRIDELVNTYVERSLDYRADMIAQTESSRAANLGLQASYQQAIDKGIFPAAAVRQFWLLSLDEKTCDICAGIAEDYPDGLPIGAEFDSEDGPIDAPPVHPNCRCSLEMRTDLDMIATPTMRRAA